MTDDIEDLDNTRQLLRLDLPAAPSVLIVDDDYLVLARLQELVAAAGYPVFTATGGSQAMQQLEASAASIVITDLSMPGMDGLELYRSKRVRGALGEVADSSAATVRTLLERADNALYASKSGGRNRVTLSNSQAMELAA